MGKHWIAAFIVSVLLTTISVQPAKADSPVTSTAFYEAYMDVDIVKEAADSGTVTESIAQYLDKEEHPIDVKAAVVNALGWSFNGKTNADKYVRLSFGMVRKDLELAELRGDQLLVLGYLLAMDDYFDTGDAEKVLLQAKDRMPDSFTAAMIHAIVAAQGKTDWQDVWRPAARVAFDPRLTSAMDMRPEAAKIIIDYMVLYSEKRVINPFEPENRIVLQIGKSSYSLNGTVFDIDPGYGTVPQIKSDQAFLPVRFLVEAVGGSIHWDSREQKVTIAANGISMKLYIGNRTVEVDGQPVELEEAPYLAGSRTMLPFRFIGEQLGFTVSWNDERKEIELLRKRP
ncbi:stalk domain-containing protein [Paenibacillus tarimensis]